jgi:hypothetical protein
LVADLCSTNSNRGKKFTTQPGLGDDVHSIAKIVVMTLALDRAS